MFKLVCISLILFAFLFNPDVCQTKIYTVHGTRHYKAFGIDFTLENDKLDDNQAQIILRNIEEDYDKNKLSSSTIEVWKELDDIYDGKFQGTIFLTILKTYLNTKLVTYLKPRSPKIVKYGLLKDFSDSTVLKTAIEGFVYFKVVCERIDIGTDYFNIESGVKSVTRYIPIIGENSIWYEHGGFEANTWGGWKKVRKRDKGEAIDFCIKTTYKADRLLQDQKKIQIILRNNSQYSAKNLYKSFYYVYKRVPNSDPIFVEGVWDDILIKTISTTSLIENRRVAISLGQKVANMLFPLLITDDSRKKYIKKCKSIGLNTNALDISKSKKPF